MTLMFIDKDEKKDIADILSALKKNEAVDKSKLGKVESIYKTN